MEQLEREILGILSEDCRIGTEKIATMLGQTPAEVRTSVCSPGGTTLAALGAMDEAGFARSLDAGVKAAIARAKELA